MLIDPTGLLCLFEYIIILDRVSYLVKIALHLIITIDSLVLNIFQLITDCYFLKCRVQLRSYASTMTVENQLN